MTVANGQRHDEQALTVVLSEALKNVSAHAYGIYIDEEDLDDLDPAVVERLSKHIEGGKLYQFIYDHIDRQIAAAGQMPDDLVSLTELEGFSNTYEIAKRVVDGLASLPKQYVMYVRGPAYLLSGKSNLSFEIGLNDRFGLISADRISGKNFESGNKTLDDWIWKDSLEPHQRHVAPKWVYLYYKSSGYIPDSGHSQCREEFESEIRSFLGCCVALGLVYPFTRAYRDKSHYTVLKTVDDFVLGPAGTLSSDVNEALHWEVSEDFGKQYRSVEKLRTLFQPLAKIMSAQGDQRLKTAATWIFRAESRGTAIDKVLETTIALEVMLGDRKMSDRVGLTKLMSNRCAYAIGKSDEQRKEIIEKFEKLYALRSQIVHSGKLILDAGQSGLVYWASHTARDFLRYELNLRR